MRLLFIITICFFLVLIIIFLGKKVFSSNKSDVVLVSDVSEIVVDSSLPVSDEFGRNLSDNNGGSFGYLKFSIKNESSFSRKYQIYLTKKKLSESKINGVYVKFYLTNDKDKPFVGFDKNKLLNYNDLHYINDIPESKELFVGTLKGNELENFVLRVWVAENYLSKNIRKFAFDISVRAI